MNSKIDNGRAKQLGGDPDWWRGAVIYQIYPRSYQDSNGDGVGDLAGIVERLPYVASLGVDAIWISPFFTSPMDDFGYDVSDYCDVDPLFGSLDDFDQLLDRAHELGLRVLIDLVISHSSDQHPWFQESRANRDNAKADWYVWADPKPDGSPPNNWLSVFGGSAWAWHGGRRQYYLHNFLASQPDLNLHNVETQDAVLDAVRFWLDRGVDGFRLDTINFYFHDQALRDNPALPSELRNSSIAPDVNPYNFQEHKYDRNRPENLDFLRRFRAVLDAYPAVATVGEVGDAHAGMEIAGAYTSGGDKVHMCYAFDFLSPEPLTGVRIADVMRRFEQHATDGWICWAFSNHDVARHASRWELDADAQRMIALLLLSLRGSISLYQGEELGLPEADVPFEALQDPYGKAFWPEFKGRDGCRTPMVWSSDAQAGFSDATPWLPIPDAHRDRAVSRQESEDASLLAFYRNALAFRRAHPVLAKGALEITRADEATLSFIRRGEGGPALFCAFNLGATPVPLDLPAGAWRQLEVYGGQDPFAGRSGDMLHPRQAYIAEEI